MRPLVYHAGLYAASAAFLKAAGFVFFLWLARTLSVGEYAAWGLLYALQTWVTSFASVGILEAVIGLLKSHATKESQQKLFTAANGCFVVTLACAVLAVGMFAAAIEDTKVLIAPLVFAIASGAILAHASLQAQMVRLEERHIESIYLNFLIPMSGLIGSLAAFTVQRTVPSFFLGSTVGLTLSLAAAMAKGIGFYGLPNGIAALRPILYRITPFIAVTSLGWLGGYGNTYIMELLFHSQEVAQFTFVFMISSAMQLIASSTNQVWSPRFYRLIRTAPLDQVEMQSQRFFLWQGLVLGVAGALIVGLFPLAIDFVGGNLVHYQSLGRELLLLTIAYAVIGPYWHCQNHFLVHDKGGLIMKVHVIAGVLGLTLLAVLLWILGPLGIYVGFLAQMALRSATALFVAKQTWPLTISWAGMIVGTVLPVGAFFASAH